MPAIRQSTSISEARDAVSAAPISASTPATKVSAPNPPPKAASPADPLPVILPVEHESEVQRYIVKNRLPFPDGTLGLDLGEPEEDSLHPASKFHIKILLRGDGGGDEQIGYTVARTLATDNYDSGFQDWYGDCLYIEEILVKPRYRGYGVGLWAIRQLMLEVPGDDDLVVIISPTPLDSHIFRYSSSLTTTSDPFANVTTSRPRQQRGEKALGRYLASIGFERMSKPAQEKRTARGLPFWGLCTAYEQPDVEEVVPHLF